MLYVVMIVSLAFSLLIETTSWSLRSNANSDNKGLFISKTNIYLYGSRLFSLMFTMGLSYLVDSSASIFELLVLIGFSYLLSSIIHLSLMDNRVQYSFNVTMMNILNIPKNSRCRLSLRRSFNINLFLNTAISAVIFCSAMVAPYFAASFYPEYRMTLGAVGQIINSFGTIVLLFFVDPILYNLMDQNKLMTCFNSYLMGRFFGFCLGGVVLIIFGIFN